MPDWSHDLRRRLSELRLSPPREAEIVEELSQHLDDRYEELRAAGSSDADARRLALEELSEAGGIAQRMKALSQAHTPAPIVHGQTDSGFLRGVWQDLWHALRTVRRQPGLSATIVVTLALGIAVNTTVFTIFNAGASTPMPIENADRVVQLSVANVGNAQDPIAGPLIPGLSGLADGPRTFEDSRQPESERSRSPGDDRPALSLHAAYVSWNTFSMIGQPPALGRDFAEADDREGALPVVILGSSLWRARYGADPSILGTTIRISACHRRSLASCHRVGFPYELRILAAARRAAAEERTSRSMRALDGLDGSGRV